MMGVPGAMRWRMRVALFDPPPMIAVNGRKYEVVAVERDEEQRITAMTGYNEKAGQWVTVKFGQYKSI